MKTTTFTSSSSKAVESLTPKRTQEVEKTVTITKSPYNASATRLSGYEASPTRIVSHSPISALVKPKAMETSHSYSSALLPTTSTAHVVQTTKYVPTVAHSVAYDSTAFTNVKNLHLTENVELKSQLSLVKARNEELEHKNRELTSRHEHLLKQLSMEQDARLKLETQYNSHMSDKHAMQQLEGVNHHLQTELQRQKEMHVG